jgi:hypothetical protein
MLHAVDLATGEIRWQTPMGEDAAGNRGLVNFGPPLEPEGGKVVEKEPPSGLEPETC